MLSSKVCQGVKCVEMQSELGRKALQGAKLFGEQSVHQPDSSITNYRAVIILNTNREICPIVCYTCA